MLWHGKPTTAFYRVTMELKEISSTWRLLSLKFLLDSRLSFVLCANIDDEKPCRLHFFQDSLPYLRKKKVASDVPLMTK